MCSSYTFLYVPCNRPVKSVMSCHESIRSYTLRPTLSQFNEIVIRSYTFRIRSAYVPPAFLKKLSTSYTFLYVPCNPLAIPWNTNPMPPLRHTLQDWHPDLHWKPRGPQTRSATTFLYVPYTFLYVPDAAAKTWLQLLWSLRTLQQLCTIHPATQLQLQLHWLGKGQEGEEETEEEGRRLLIRTPHTHCALGLKYYVPIRSVLPSH